METLTHPLPAPREGRTSARGTKAAPALAPGASSARSILARPAAKARRRPAICCHTTIRITTTQATEFTDITDRLQRFIDDAGLSCGIVNVQTRHTTTAVVVNEHEPRLLVDFVALLETTVPQDGRYRHDDPNTGLSFSAAERPNGHAHCRALLLPCSVCLNVVAGRLLVGQWQRVFLAELDGPREREISVVLQGNGAR